VSARKTKCREHNFRRRIVQANSFCRRNHSLQAFGDVDFELKWSEAAAAAATQGPAPNDAPALTTAVQEQLGLKLQPDRGPVAVLVVDRVSEPTEN